LRLADALGWFWNRRTYWHEGRDWLERFLEEGDQIPISVQAKSVYHLLELSREMGDRAREHVFYEKAIVLIAVVEDSWVKAWLLTSLGFGTLRDDLHTVYLDEALALFTTLADQLGICDTLGRLSGIHTMLGNFDYARKLAEHGIRLAHQARDKSVICWLKYVLTLQNWIQGKMDAQAERLNDEALALFQELGYKNGTHLAYCQLGQIAHFRGEDERAKTLFEQSLMLGQQIGKSGGFGTQNLIGLSEIFCGQGEAERGARLLGAIDEPIQPQLTGSIQYAKRVTMDLERALAAAHSQLDEATFAAAYAKGQAMTLDQAVAYALAKTSL